MGVMEKGMRQVRCALRVVEPFPPSSPWEICVLSLCRTSSYRGCRSQSGGERLEEPRQVQVNGVHSVPKSCTDGPSLHWEFHHNSHKNQNKATLIVLPRNHWTFGTLFQSPISTIRCSPKKSNYLWKFQWHSTTGQLLILFWLSSFCTSTSLWL